MERFLHPRESPTSSSETQKQTPKRQRKYDETFLQYGFTSITENNEEKPKCPVYREHETQQAQKTF